MADDRHARVLDELHFALAEADAAEVAGSVRSRVMSRALAGRPAGFASTASPHASGRFVFVSAVGQLDALLAALSEADWRRTTIRGLDVQGLVGHLIGVEAAFAAAAEGLCDAAAHADHVASTQPEAAAQRGLAPEETLERWRGEVSRTLRALDRPGTERSIRGFYGISLPLDPLLVIRAFELWIHGEDIRRATGRSPARPDAAALDRMTDLAVSLLPSGLAGAGIRGRADQVRLVLTGPGGGTWIVPLDGSAPSRPNGGGDRQGARVVVDAADFCRVVGNRAGVDGVETDVAGDRALVADLFEGASALALD